MLQLTPHMRILVATETIDGRKGIDSLARLCRKELGEDPFSGAVFLFLNRSRTTLKVLCYDGQGYVLAQKRLSEGKFRWWPSASTPSKTLEAHQVQMLLAAGNPDTDCAPMWRRIDHR